MAKFRPKVESVDAVQVRFTDKGSWPKWLEGKVFVGDAREDRRRRRLRPAISSSAKAAVTIYKPDAFAGRFDPSARRARGGSSESHRRSIEYVHDYLVARAFRIKRTNTEAGPLTEG